MRISYNWLQSFFSSSLPRPADLARLLTLYVVEVENIEKIGKDYVFILDVLPNRAHDLLSHRGAAREIAALTGSRIKLQRGRPKERTKEKTTHALKVEVVSPRLAPRYTARVVSGVKVGPSPRWVRERLESVGVRSINNVVDATNYVMMELGQPLHAFDLDKLETDKRGTKQKSLVVRKAKKGEKITTLDSGEKELEGSMLVIADSRRPIALAGIMGGKNTEVDTTTKNLILESATFDAKNIRKTSRVLELKSESSLRFEAGIDSSLASEANDALAGFIQELAGGDVLGGIIDVSSAGSVPSRILLRHGRVESLLGISLKEKHIIRILSRLGFAIRPKEKAAFLVTIPSFRGDVISEEDLIEEIGRVYGYEKIVPSFPVFKAVPPTEDEYFIIGDTIRNTLAGLGYSETYSYSFAGEKEISGIHDDTRRYVRIQNPLRLDFAYLNKSLVIPLLKNIRLNQRHVENIKLFELGTVYEKNAAWGEKSRLTVGLAVKRIGRAREEFYLLKGVVETLFEALGISDVSYRELGDDSPYRSYVHSAISAEILIAGEGVGAIGEVKRDILENFKIDGQVFFVDLDFDSLVMIGIKDTRYRALPQYPPLIQDIAVLVDLDTRVEEVLNVINGAGGELVADVDLFDIYEGEELPDGKKNLAFHIIYQASDRTLSQKEVDSVHAKIAKSLEEELGGEVRK